MNISTDTLSILKNFSEINQNILFRPGSTINTISQAKNILAQADITEKFEREFGVYDLPEFLRTVEMFEKPSINFTDEDHLVIGENDESVDYFFSDKSVILSTDKGINMPDKTVTFTLTKDVYTKLIKAYNTLSLPDVSVEGDGTNISIRTLDKKNDTSNKWKKIIGKSNVKFKAYFKAENFKIIPDDYDVSISKQKISNFNSRNKSLQYWIALEPDSKF